MADIDTGVGVIVPSNGPFEIYGVVRSIAQFALDLAVAAETGDPPPEAPPIVDPFDIADADAFDGEYRGDAGAIRIDPAAAR
jgi:hypothetical protein